MCSDQIWWRILNYADFSHIYRPFTKPVSRYIDVVLQSLAKVLPWSVFLSSEYLGFTLNSVIDWTFAGLAGVDGVLSRER